MTILARRGEARRGQGFLAREDFQFDDLGAPRRGRIIPGMAGRSWDGWAPRDTAKERWTMKDRIPSIRDVIAFILVAAATAIVLAGLLIWFESELHF